MLQHRHGMGSVGGEISSASRDNTSFIHLSSLLGRPSHIISSESCLVRDSYWQPYVRATIRNGQESKSEESDSVGIFLIEDVFVVQALNQG